MSSSSGSSSFLMLKLNPDIQCFIESIFVLENLTSLIRINFSLKIMPLLTQPRWRYRVQLLRHYCQQLFWSTFLPRNPFFEKLRLSCFVKLVCEYKFPRRWRICSDIHIIALDYRICLHEAFEHGNVCIYCLIVYVSVRCSRRIGVQPILELQRNRLDEGDVLFLDVLCLDYWRCRRRHHRNEDIELAFICTIGRLCVLIMFLLIAIFSLILSFLL